MDSVVKSNVIEKKVVTPVEFSDFNEKKIEKPNRDISIYVDLPKEIFVELGQTKMSLREILELDPGDVIELSKQAGESVDVYVDKELIAKGEVVVMEDKFAVRITEIAKLTDLEKKII
jgi:flagellar motor switch protein FliN/FliY